MRAGRGSGARWDVSLLIAGGGAPEVYIISDYRKLRAAHMAPQCTAGRHIRKSGSRDAYIRRADGPIGFPRKTRRIRESLFRKRQRIIALATPNRARTPAFGTV